MQILERLFGKSPFGPLIEHAKKVNECIEFLMPVTEAWLKGDWKEVERLQKRISKAEHQADDIKINIRHNLPKGHFYPVPRGGLLRVLKNQDDMADSVEDFAIVLTLRKTTLPETLRADFQSFIEKVVKTCKKALSAIKDLDILLEASFVGPEAEKVLATVDEVGKLEWEVDLHTHALVKKLLLQEDQIPTLNIIFCMNIIQTLSRLCNHAENSGDNICHMIISRR
jgi:predicted phosphate transport protein (TIGR00153 family)